MKIREIHEQRLAIAREAHTLVRRVCGDRWPIIVEEISFALRYTMKAHTCGAFDAVDILAEENKCGAAEHMSLVAVAL
ncbi:MAG: hypothetical protein ABFD89_03745, partial [Bryobacteraceae bacterium]